MTKLRIKPRKPPPPPDPDDPPLRRLRYVLAAMEQTDPHRLSPGEQLRTAAVAMDAVVAMMPGLHGVSLLTHRGTTENATMLRLEGIAPHWFLGELARSMLQMEVVGDPAEIAKMQQILRDVLRVLEPHLNTLIN